jgi:hypothetical protein
VWFFLGALDDLLEFVGSVERLKAPAIADATDTPIVDGVPLHDFIAEMARPLAPDPVDLNAVAFRVR